MNRDSNAARRLRAESYIDLVTFKKDGTRAHTPVWHVVEDDAVFVFTQRESWKVRRMLRDPRVEVRACSMNGHPRGDTWQGRGAVLQDPASESRIYDSLVAKYGWQMRLVMLLASISGRRSGWCVCRLDLGVPAA